MKRIIWVIIFLSIKCVTPESACFAWEKSSPGSKALLEAAGTTLVSATQEKVLFRYTIRPGDTLWDIAKWALDDPFMWPELLKYNFIQNPDLIYPGVLLVIPSTEVLARIQAVQDVDEIQKLRQENEQDARFVDMPAIKKEVTPSSESVFSAFIDQQRLGPQVEAQDVTTTSSALTVTGRKNITFQYQQQRGVDNQAYYSNGYKRQESLDLNLSGQLHDQIKVKGHFFQSDQQLEEDYSLEFSHQHGELFLGNFNAALPDTNYVLSDRQLTGGRLELKFKQ